MGENACDDVFDWAARDPGRVTFSWPAHGGWAPVTAREFASRVAAVAAGLIAERIRPGDRIGLMAAPSLEWAICDFAIWAAGAVTVPIYETSSVEQIRWILGDCGAVAVFAGTASLADSVRRAQAATVEAVWVLDRDLDLLAGAGAGGSPEGSRSCRSSSWSAGTSGNTNPPSIALLAFAAAQCGLVITAEPAVTRLLARPTLWRRVRSLNATTMTVYLWHFVPVIIIAVAFYPPGVMPQPAIGTAEWWESRLAWWALLTVVLVALVAAVMRAERPMTRLPAGIGRPGPWSPALLAAGVAASMYGLARLAISGFTPGGHLPALALAACAVGLAATLLTGRTPAADATQQAVGSQQPRQPHQQPKAA